MSEINIDWGRLRLIIWDLDWLNENLRWNDWDQYRLREIDIFIECLR